MDPCPFVRLIVESFALKLPPAARLAGPGVHPSPTPCFCSIQLQDFPSLTAPLPRAFDLTSSTNLIDAAAAAASAPSSPVIINLDPAALEKMSGRADAGPAAVQATVVQNGWVSMASGQGAARLHLLVWTEPDPRFVFQFGCEPECNPVVYQIQGGNPE
ncbi:uncharacterized protein LOC122030340 [Zingiber officinale]|uniref:uncharacterized protein LOC122030340 n=1 Tax=Zingiber officinale TaxID=94328 RepID=UPI001C4B44A1|nr:uncharacterized protein LOC122030340 [Zingiber officinale]